MIAEARAALATALEDGGLRVFEYIPERAEPPMAILLPAGDWVTGGDTFGSFRVGFDVMLMVRPAASETESSALDDLVDETLTAISGAAGFYASNVSAPTRESEADYLSTTITVYQNTSL